MKARIPQALYPVLHLWLVLLEFSFFLFLYNFNKFYLAIALKDTDNVQDKTDDKINTEGKLKKRMILLTVI